MVLFCAYCPTTGISISSNATGSQGASKVPKNNSLEKMTNAEMATVANKCLDVVKDELKNRDLPVALLFIDMTEKVISAIAGNTTTGPNNSSLIIQPNMCDWDDPESKAEGR